MLGPRPSATIWPNVACQPPVPRLSIRRTTSPGPYALGVTARVLGSALFDATGRYRYRLDRRWGPGPRVAFVMLNPSTANAARDDPTIRRCVGFARAWGFGSLEVVNLFAFRATEPRELTRAADPVGPENDRHVARACARADLIVVAWGGAALARAREPLTHLRRKPVYCLGRTRAGAPQHPLYLRASTRPVPFAGPPGRIAGPPGRTAGPPGGIAGAPRATGRGPRRRLPRS